ncbi:MAG: T9SS type A sorting domain-containing protein [candidate division Zixibacteria bacterium]|nr:T9SS type A sorting domain-containing protein [candidate division Zixibacteria bacterium]
MKFRLTDSNKILAPIIFGLISLYMYAPLAAQDSLWAVNFGGKYNESTGGIDRLATGDFILCGSTYSYGAGEYDIYVIKTDSVGTVLWDETFGDTATEYGNDIQKTSDNGFIISGSTNSTGAGKRDLYLLKIDSVGNELWSKTYGGTSHEDGHSVQELYDKGFIVCGTTESFGTGTDIYLLRTDSLGDTLWTKTYGGSNGESGAEVRVTSDSGFIMIGNTGSYGTGYSSIYVVRTDSIGDTVWTATYGNDRADMGAAIELTNDNGFILGGTTVLDGENYYDAYAVKIDSLGVLEWDSTYGGSYEDRIYSIKTTPDGGYIFGGITDNGGARKMDIMMLKTDAAGATEWSNSIGGDESDYCRSVILDGQNDYFALGYSYSASTGGSDMYLAKIQRAGATAVDDYQPLLPNDLYTLSQNYPNPFNLSTQIDFTLLRQSSYSITIFNILGQVVRRWEDDFVPAGNYILTWDGTDENGSVISSGVYFYRLQASDFVDTKKMVLVK